MNKLVCFADENMSISQNKLVDSWNKYNVGQAALYDPKCINEWFIRLNKDIFDQPRGCGYWLWKPSIIYGQIMDMKEGDYLFYSDSGIQFVDNPLQLINFMDSDVMLFSNGWPHIEWCKMDVIRAINGVSGFSITQTNEGPFITANGYESFKQVQASNIVIRVSEFSRKFIHEWLMWCQIPGFIDDSPGKDNYPTFAEHRHDQAILTCLQIKYGITQHWFCSTTNLHQRENFPNDKYGPIFEHHRKRNTEW